MSIGDEVAAIREIGESLELAIPAWHDAIWPEKRDPRVIAAKLAEEAGEVCGAVIKFHEGRRNRQDVADEIGDVLIVLTVLARRYGLPALDDLRAARFVRVQERP